MIRFFLTVATLIAAYGCAGPVDEREMNHLASALTKVSAAVDATVRYGSTPTGGSAEDLLSEATKHDASLLSHFNGKDVFVHRDGDDSAVLICEKNAGRALLEDAGCTPQMDSHRWSAVGTGQCRFTLNVKALCAR